MSCSSTAKTPRSLNSSRNALPGPLSSMQCRHARLHSLVICQATYNGARSSLEPVAAAKLAGGSETAAGSVAPPSITSSVLQQALASQIRNECQHLALNDAADVAEPSFQALDDLTLIDPRRDLAHYRGCRGIQRVDP